MIEQYLLQTNESATVPVLQKILELNKALVDPGCRANYFLLSAATLATTICFNTVTFNFPVKHRISTGL